MESQADIVYDNWSLFSDSNARWIEVAPEHFPYEEAVYRLTVEQYSVQEGVKRYVAEQLYGNHQPPRISVGFRMVAVNVSSTSALQQGAIEHTPTLSIVIEGDFDGILHTMGEMMAEPHQPEPSTRRSRRSEQNQQKRWRSQKIRVDYFVGQLFKALRNYHDDEHAKLREMTYNVQFTGPYNQSYTVNSAIQVVYYTPTA
ncbi:hypothetical protein F5Y12DRAFT_715601 [Xylaria sp. FL1777]|nr:hypothetical protein F5Y12DRAFT_715601 [Xylaria sp. FL1777]